LQPNTALVFSSVFSNVFWVDTQFPSCDHETRV
jgi:hypothetical protein